jgi:hypothetical protein
MGSKGILQVPEGFIRERMKDKLISRTGTEERRLVLLYGPHSATNPRIATSIHGKENR